MYGQHQPTPTEAAAIKQHLSFRQKIAERAAALHAPKPIDLIAATWEPASSPEHAAAPVSCPTCGAAPPNPLHAGDGPLMKIKRAVCRHFEVTHHDLISARRQKYIILPRQIAMFLCKQLTESSLPAIGRAFGGRDHTTALHATRKIEALFLAHNPRVSEPIAKIRADLVGVL